MQITWCFFGLVLLVCAVSLTFYVLFSLKSIEQMMITFASTKLQQQQNCFPFLSSRGPLRVPSFPSISPL